MKIPVWKEGMSDSEAKDGAYWERNMLALHMATYTNLAWSSYMALHPSEEMNKKYGDTLPCGWYKHQGEGFEGWGRVISLFDGKMTFHVPDDFDLGDLPEIEPNWNGHTTQEKWIYAMKKCGISIPKEEL